MPGNTESPWPQAACVVAARQLALGLLSDNAGRWVHTQAVAARAATAAGLLPTQQVPALLCAAWLHDIGYAPSLRDTSFHPLDGARYLQEHAWPEHVVGLVAHHSSAWYVADILGLTDELAAFDHPTHTSGPLADALTWADQTISPAGHVIDVHARLAEKLHRHGPDSPTTRAHAARAPELLRAVADTDAALRRAATLCQTRDELPDPHSTT